MAYPAYDNFSRTLSRRSMGYGATPLQHAIYPEDGYPDPSYSMYGPPPRAATMPISHRLTGPSYENLDVRDPYYSDVGHRHRRHSVSYATYPTPVLDTYRLPGSQKIKFKRRGSFTSGISLAEAQDHVRLSGNDSYRVYDFHADSRSRILLRIQWHGYSPMTYELPLENYDGHVSLQTVARRISRACVHYLQANIIPIVWDRVQLHHLEEVSYGIWQPMLSA
ncbi:hypothetical protein H0H92_006987 [Tricholoma furcatifolium]|nr:hypothetical protein H0H92_006987 [Tricholoma furcatifolium]